MRLDKYLKVSRLIKRRTVANEACDAGRIVVNVKIARASYDVKENDIIENVPYIIKFYIADSDYYKLINKDTKIEKTLPVFKKVIEKGSVDDVSNWS